MYRGVQTTETSKTTSRTIVPEIESHCSSWHMASISSELQTMLPKSKIRSFLKQDISENSNNQREIFKVANTLLYRNKSNKLPSFTNPTDLANSFLEYFHSKIENILNTTTTCKCTTWWYPPAGTTTRSDIWRSEEGDYADQQQMLSSWSCSHNITQTCAGLCSDVTD